MGINDWMSLTGRQRHALILSMAVRDALEDFHIENLSDEQMEQLNQVTRFAIYDAIGLIETATRSPASSRSYQQLVRLIPDYWEIPGGEAQPEIDRAS